MNKKIMVFAIVALVGLPMAAAASQLENLGVVTGHTVYANMGGFDPDVAVIAGVAESKVVWFNGQTIFSTLGQGFVYAAEAESCNPLTGKNYTFRDYELTFIDPNDEAHIVAHYTYRCSSYTGTPLDLLPGGEPGLHHVWVTVTHAVVSDPPVHSGDAGRSYNFALAVNTANITRTLNGAEHDHQGGTSTQEINEGDSFCKEETDKDHVCNGGYQENEDAPGTHSHNTAQIDLYFSRTDRGDGAALPGGGTHPGTDDGCTSDTHCAAVTAPGNTYVDPTGAT